MDEVDSPMIRPRQPRVRNTFQNELSSKLSVRRSQGLTSDMTSDDSESDDNVGELGFSSLRSRNRPSSAKRRAEPPNLGATMRFQDKDTLFGKIMDDDRGKGGSKFMKKPGNTESNLEGRKTPTGLTADDILNDRKTPIRNDDRKSPFLSRKSPLLEDLQGHRNTEWQPPSYQKKAPSPDFLSRDVSGSSHSQKFTSNLTKDPSVDGTSEAARRRQQFERSPRLDPLDSPTGKPSPRPRKSEPSEDIRKKRTATMDLFGSNRITLDEDDEEETTFPSPKPKRRQSKDLDRNKQYDTRKSPTDGRKIPTDERKFRQDGRKTPTDEQKFRQDGRKTPTDEQKFRQDGRKTPTDERKFRQDGRKTPTDEPKFRQDGRKTPTDERKFRQDGRKTPTDEQKFRQDGRKTPTDERKFRQDGRKMPTDERKFRKDDRKTPTDEQKFEKSSGNRTPSLMELMTEGDQSSTHNKPYSRYKKDKSQDSFTDEMEGYKPRKERQKSSGNENYRTSPSAGRHHRDVDESSICEEYDVDPNPPRNNTIEPETKPRKSLRNQTTEHKVSDMIIDNVAASQNTMLYIDPDKNKIKSAKSEKIDQHKPKPRYSTLPGSKSEPVIYDVNDTKSIRDAVFVEWYQEKMKKSKEELKEKKKTEKEKENKKEQDKKDKLSEAQSSYNAWTENKKETLKQQSRLKMKENRKKEGEFSEKEEKKVTAVKCFVAWKENKDHGSKHQLIKHQREEHNKKMKETDDKNKRAKSASSAFRYWRDKKEVVLRKKLREEKQNKPDIYEKEQIEMKEAEAREKYEEWLEEKEKREIKDRDKKRHQQLTEENEFRPPWSPASRTIPFGM